MRGSAFCIGHDPDQAEARRRRASKGGKRGGRGRPLTELAGIKTRLSTLADDVLEGSVDRSDAAVVSQVLNVLLRAVEVERKVREADEFERRLEALEESSGGAGRGGGRWGA